MDKCFAIFLLRWYHAVKGYFFSAERTCLRMSQNFPCTPCTRHCMTCGTLRPKQKLHIPQLNRTSLGFSMQITHFLPSPSCMIPSSSTFRGRWGERGDCGEIGSEGSCFVGEVRADSRVGGMRASCPLHRIISISPRRNLRVLVTGSLQTGHLQRTKDSAK